MVCCGFTLFGYAVLHAGSVLYAEKSSERLIKMNTAYSNALSPTRLHKHLGERLGDARICRLHITSISQYS